MKEDTYEHERDHDWDNERHLEDVRRDLDRHLDKLRDQYSRSERHEDDRDE